MGVPVDIFALGVMLFAMVTGNMPFDFEKNLSQDPKDIYKDPWYKLLIQNRT